MKKDVKVEGSLDGIFSKYLKKKRMDEVKPYLGKCKKVLDIGCGIFGWQAYIPPHTEFIGIDVNETIIHYNQHHFSYQFFHLDIEIPDLNFMKADFDLIILLAVIEHLADPEACLRKLKKLLTPNGLIVLTTPHPTGKFILTLGSSTGLLAGDKHEHNRLFNHHNLQRIALENDLTLMTYRRFLFGFNQLVVLKKKISQRH